MTTDIETIIGGDAATVAEQLREFRESAQVLSSSRERLINEHARHWVGVVRGGVLATGDSADDVIAALKEQGVDPNDAIIRFIDRELKTLIL